MSLKVKEWLIALFCAAQTYGIKLHAVKNILAMISYHHQLWRSMGHIFGKKKRCFRDPAILSKGNENDGMLLTGHAGAKVLKARRRGGVHLELLWRCN